VLPEAGSAPACSAALLEVDSVQVDCLAAPPEADSVPADSAWESAALLVDD
jgi:hypothetical protein